MHHQSLNTFSIQPNFEVVPRSERQRAMQSTRLSLRTRYVNRSARYKFVAHASLKFPARIVAQNRSDRATKTRYESIVAPAGLTVMSRCCSRMHGRRARSIVHTIAAHNGATILRDRDTRACRGLQMKVCNCSSGNKLGENDGETTD